MKIVIAPDSFKGSLSAREVTRTISKAFILEMPNVQMELVPMADGGEGTLDSLVFATNGTIKSVEATGPLGKKITTQYGVLGDGQTVIIEMAKIAGLPMVPAAQRNPYHTTTPLGPHLQ